MEKNITKNIILCADGTGNEGGYTPDSNVYKMYNAIDIHNDEIEQIIFYDNGVGTQSNKYIRALSGGVGVGFQHNVCDLYEYLARHYNPGDNIYLFGFSRGAATIRAFNGFMDACGLIDGRGKSNQQLKHDVKCAVKAYQKPHQRDYYLSNITIHEKMPEITFLGVWDTVSALGFPERTDTVTPFLTTLNMLFKGLSFVVDRLFPHKYYNYELTPNIKIARQALAIDDERTSFWPKVWNESTTAAKQVESIDQVWFTGMHSNVGGGYERAGLANTSFYWMLKQIQELKQIKGLKFKPDTLESAKMDANVNGRMYNSRQGLASFYRYHPRDITALCKTANIKVKVHESVLCRLTLRTANYAPRLLPESFQVVDNEGNSKVSPKVNTHQWSQLKKSINRVILFRKILYGVQIDIVIFILTLMALLHCNLISLSQSDAILAGNNAQGMVASIVNKLETITPSELDPVIGFLVVQRPIIGTVLATLIILFLLLRGKARRMTSKYAEGLRRLIIQGKT